ncbi:hypothetical protein ACI7BZ_05085 [Xanthobacter sp. AM11]|uniref:hypothetical protein n=1 Tax=Xanthobacter sp. AM11 TaxID=3380643 RepID=UPI0039BFC36F
MADYYPLLVRAISSLPQKTAENRRAVYDRARTALMRQLRSVDPPLPEGEITRERMGLEEAIRRLEAEHAQQDNAEPENAGVDAFEPEPPPVETAPPAGRPAPPEPGPRTPPAAASSGTVPPAAPSPADPLARTERRGLPPREPAEPDEAPADRRPPLRRGEVRSRGAAAGARRNGRPEGGVSWQKFALWALLVLVVLGGIAFAVINRDMFLGGESRPVAQNAAPSPDQPKSADRVTAASGGDAARRAPAPSRTGAAGTARAFLLEESPGTSTPQTFEGTVTWKTETVNAGPGLPPDIALRGDIVIPERQIAMSFVLRRNADQTLPASHTIEMSFKLPQDFAFGGIASVAGVRMKPNQQAQGTPLAGLPVRVNPTFFLVGLSEAAADRQRNVALLQAYPWLDTLFIYSNNKKAALTFEKGAVGEQAFNDAFSAWGELIQRPPAQPGQPGQPNGG